MMMALLSFRPMSLQTLARSVCVPKLLPRRSICFTSIRLAEPAEGPNAILAQFSQTKLFKQIADKPDALSALQDLGKLLKDNGIDVTSGQPPSKFQMFRLIASPEFRESAQRVLEELKKAGVNLTSQDVLNEVMNLRKKAGEDS